MDKRFENALVAFEADLISNLSLVGLLPYLELAAGGFLTKLEKGDVLTAAGQEKVVRILFYLRKKGNEDFRKFLVILDKSGNEIWASKLRERAGLTESGLHRSTLQDTLSLNSVKDQPPSQSNSQPPLPQQQPQQQYQQQQQQQPRPKVSQPAVHLAPEEKLAEETVNSKSSSDPTPRSGQPSSTASQDPSPSDDLIAKTNYRFAIMVTNDNELHAAMHFLGGSSLEWSKVTEDVKSCTYEVEGDDKLMSTWSVTTGTKMFSRYRPIRVGTIPGVVVQCGTMGSFTELGSHHTTLQLMQDATEGGWKLNNIFIVGCCGTRPDTMIAEENIPIGTVLVADEIFQYAMGKLYDDSPEWHPKSCFSPSLVNLKDARRGDDACGIVESVRATFLSGDFVIKGENTASKLAELHQQRKQVGFEMEGVGAIKAIRDAEIFLPDGVTMPKVVLVKGVSDKAGGDKNKSCAIVFFPETPEPDKLVCENSRQQMCTIKSLTLVLRYIVQNKAKFTK